MRAADLIPRLEDVRRLRDGWAARCPAHDDERASLSIADGRKGIVLHCHAGCDTAAVAGALGITVQDLFSDAGADGTSQRTGKFGTVIAEYDYTDEHGTLLYQVLRTDAKQFPQRYPDGHGGWIWKKCDRQVLYRLPAVIEAVALGRPIWIAEGEKDVESLERRGAVATTKPGGAKARWLTSYTESLRGATVRIVADKDDAGRKCAAEIAEALNGVAAAVEIVEARKGKDATDHLTSGFGLDDFIRPGEADRTRPAITQLSSVTPEPVSWLWEPYIPRRKITLLEGDPGCGKTWVALSIASVLSHGNRWPVGGHARVGRTLYLTAEDGIADTLRPRLDAVGADVSRIYALTGTIRIDPATGEEIETGGVTIADVSTIEAALEEVRPALVVIDPIQGFLGANVDMHRANEVRPLLHQLSRWAEKYDCAMLVIRHLSKSPAAKGIYRGLGSIDFTAAARSVLLAGESPETGDRAVVHIKSSLAAAGSSVGYELRAGHGLWWTGESDATAGSILAAEPVESERSALDDAEEWIRAQLRDGPVSAEEIRKRARKDGIAWRTISRAKRAAGATSRKTGEEWVWTLENKDATPPQNEVGILGTLDKSNIPHAVSKDAKNANESVDARMASLDDDEWEDVA